ncbi:MAG: hypothetical protein EBQ73_03735, partial [Gammaproteobacteria bacterium]|nr:hypothetical protein [Gammaproteobacteria bacterium]
LKHCAEVLVQQVVTKGSVSTKLDRRIRGSLIDAARQELPSRQPFMSDDGLASIMNGKVGAVSLPPAAERRDSLCC